MGDILDIVGLRKAFGSTIALNDVSLSIPEQSIVGLLGPNGAGKTTLMKALVGLVKPDAGKVRLGRRPGRSSEVAIGAMIERPGFYPYLSARRNLEALGLTAGLSRRSLRDQVPAILERVDLRAAADRRFGEFSTGMKQRLALGATLLGSREVLILDEPVSGLDPAGVASVRRLLLQLRAEGRTILVSSHLLGEVEQVCDRIAIINLGRVMASGPIAEIASGPATWRLIFATGEQAEKAATLLDDGFTALVSGSEVSAVARDDTDRSPLEVVARLGVVPREAKLEQPSLEEAYLRLTGAQQSEHNQ
jgi:ABC-2 type transport system ATP-binding protein